MTPLVLDSSDLALLAATGGAAGVLGALVGIGGGVLVTPALVLGFGVPVHVAIATGLVTVIATSTAAGSVYVGEGLTNLRLAMTLELATTSGAIAGGLTAALLSGRALVALLAAFLAFTSVLLLLRTRGATGARPAEPSGPVEVGFELAGRLGGAYFDRRERRLVEYRARHLPAGLAASLAAGALSGMLGVGGGFMKVPAMHLLMGVPIKVAAATSNFMIGVTASASLFIYVARGLVYPEIAAPVALGVMTGALGGTRLAARLSSRWLARLLAVVLAVVAVELAVRAVGGHGAR